MKAFEKILSLILAMVMILGLAPITAFAEPLALSPDSVSFSAIANKESLAVGEEIEVAVSTGGASGVVGLQFELKYDPTVLEYKSHSTAHASFKAADFRDNSTKGIVTGLFEDATTLGVAIAQGEILKLVFTAKAVAASSAIGLTIVELYGPKGSNPQSQYPDIANTASGASVAVTAAPVPATGVTITEGAAASLATNKSLTLHATVEPAGSSDAPVWSSSAKDVATIDPATGVISPLKTGETIISAKAGAFSASLTLTVTQSVPEITVKVGVYDYTAGDAKISGASKTGVILANSTEVTVPQTATAYEAFIKAFSENGGISSKDSDGYFSSINGLAEKAPAHAESGWVFCVNDSFGNLGSATQTLKNGDVIEMHYSLAGYGADVGSFFAPYLPTITSFELAGVKKLVSITVDEYGNAQNGWTTKISHKLDGQPMTGSGTDKDPFIIPIVLPSGTLLKSQTAALTTDLNKNYWSLYTASGILDVSAAQDYSADVTFALQTNGGVLKTYYTVKAALAPEAGVQAVIDAIAAIGEPSLWSAPVIAEARSLYSALDASKQGAISNYALLEAAEATLAQLKAAADGKTESLLWAMQSKSYSSFSDVSKPLDGTKEFFCSSASNSANPIRGAVSAEVTDVKVDGVSAPLSNGVFTAELKPEGETRGVRLHKLEFFTSGSSPAETQHLMSFWAPEYDCRGTYLDGYNKDGQRIDSKLIKGQPTDYKLGYLLSRFSISNSLETFYPEPDINFQYYNDTYKYELIDPYTGEVLASRDRLPSDPDFTNHPLTINKALKLNVGSNFFFVKAQQYEDNTYTATRPPIVFAVYVDRVASSETAPKLTEIKANGSNGVSYPLTPEFDVNKNSYSVTADWNETSVDLVMKMPEAVSYSATYYKMISGYQPLTTISDTVSGGIRTFVLTCPVIDRYSKDPYADYEVELTNVFYAPDGIGTGSYIVNLRRPAGRPDGATDSDLKSLTVNSGSATLDYTLNGENKVGFDPSVTEYTVKLPTTASSVYINAVSKFISSGAIVSVNGRRVSQQASNANTGKSETYPVSTGMEPLIFTIVVTPPAGSKLAPKTYKISVTKPFASTAQTPYVMGWKLSAGSSDQLVSPGSGDSTEVAFLPEVKLNPIKAIWGGKEYTQNINFRSFYGASYIETTGDVDYCADILTVTPTYSAGSCPTAFSYSVNGAAKVLVPGFSPLGFNIPIPTVGLNAIMIYLTSEDGKTVYEREFKITRGTNAMLSGLSSNDAVFVSKFHPTLYYMEMLLNSGTTSATVTAKAADPSATVVFNGVTGTGSATASGLQKDQLYTLSVASGATKLNYTVLLNERQSFSPDSVVAVMPAPGQFVNEHSQTVTGIAGGAGWGDGWDQTLYGANSNQAGRKNGAHPGYSLGSYGGFITYKFNTPIENSPSNLYGIDFSIFGNAFYNSSEPAGVMVSQDGSTWYTLAGSMHYEDTSTWDYSVTYYNPDPKFDPYVAKDVYWEANNGESGYVPASGGYHPKPAYPVAENYLFEGNGAASLYSPEKLTLSGPRIRGSEVFFGYADVHPNPSSNFDKPGNPYRPTALDTQNILAYKDGQDYGDGFDLNWAVDANGYPVHLDSISYIKVYSATMGINVGDISPELTGLARTTGEGSAVGMTAAPTITVNGNALALKDGVFKYNVEVSGAVEIDAALENANVWVNSNQLGSFSAAAVKDGRIVRIIAQEGQKEPSIYYITLYNGSSPVIKDVVLSPSGATNGNVTVTVNASDNLAVTGYSFDNGSNWQTENSKEYTSNATIAADYIQVKDSAGNITKYPAAVVIDFIDKTPPEISSAVFAQIKNQTSKGTITVSASDDISLASVQLTGTNYDQTKTAAPYVFDVTADGSYTVKATDAAGNSANSSLSVKFIALKSITIKPKETSSELDDGVLNVKISSGETKTFELKAVLDPEGSAALYDLLWSSSKTAVASVDQNGVVTAKAPGVAIISAAVGGLKDSVLVEVKQAGHDTVNSGKEMNGVVTEILPNPSETSSLTSVQKAQLTTILETIQKLPESQKSQLDDETIEKLDELLKKDSSYNTTISVTPSVDEKLPETERMPVGSKKTKAVGLIAASGANGSKKPTAVELFIKQVPPEKGMKYTFELSLKVDSAEDVQLLTPILITIEMAPNYKHEAGYQIKHTKKNGSVEWLDYSYNALDNTISFRVNSLSPFSIGLNPANKTDGKKPADRSEESRRPSKKDSSPATPVEIPSPSAEINPATGARINSSALLVLALAAAALCKKRR